VKEISNKVSHTVKEIKGLLFNKRFFTKLIAYNAKFK